MQLRSFPANFLSRFLFLSGSFACLSFCVPTDFYLATIPAFFVFYLSDFHPNGETKCYMMKQIAIWFQNSILYYYAAYF
jgi:hypothetical protein